MRPTDSAPTPPRRYHRVLTIAGSDSGGGAGIQADLKTFAAMGCYGTSAITALTAQNTLGVTGIHPVPPTFAAAQITAVLGDIGTDAVKIGMLYSAELIRVVAEQLRVFGAANIVLDPVMVAASGDKLLQDEAVAALRDCLMPLADVITPNIPEAEVLVGHKLDSPELIRAAAQILAGFGSRSVLIKGGHFGGESSDDLLYLSQDRRFVAFPAVRIQSRNTHGTGCTLSSAIAAHLARGAGLEEAVRRAKEFIDQAIRAGTDYALGGGHGPVHHFFKHWG